MKYKFLLILLTTILFSCGEFKPEKYYDYHWVVDVTYTNGESEQLTIEQKNVTKVWKLYLGSDAGESCLIKTNGIYDNAIACGVRKFTIISETRIENSKQNN